MKSVIVLLAGLIAGVVLSGVGTAVLIPLMPEGWRGETAVWVVAGTVTVMTMTVFSLLFLKPQK